MKYSRSKILILTLIMEGFALLLAFLLAGYFEISLLRLTDNFYQDMITGFAGALLPFAFFLFTLSDRANRIASLKPLRRIVRTDIKEIFSNTKLPDLIFISLLAGFSEEMLFRGVIQAEFGIVIASIVFGLVHCISGAYVIITVIMGIYIGAFYYFSNSLLVPIQIHFIYDLAALIYLRYYVAADNAL